MNWKYCVEQTPGVMAHETVGEHTHEAGQHDEIGLMGVDGGGKRGIEGFAARVILVIDNLRGNAMRGSKAQAGGIGPV